jgi:heme O synthase-like polyprenyltransferase
MSKVKTSSLIILCLAILSIMVCWLYGLPGLCLGLWSLVKSIKLSKEKNPAGKVGKILKNAKKMAIAGSFLSLLFCIYYFLVIINGSFIRF